MKICPKCNQTYNDESLNYCLNDGTVLVSTSENKTAEQFRNDPVTSNNPTARYTNYTPAPSQATIVKQNVPKKSNPILWVLLILGGLVLVCGGGIAGMYAFYLSQNSSNVNLNSNDLLANKNSDQNTKPSLTRSSPANQSNQTNSNDVTMEKYLQVKPKMSYKQAVEIFGSEGVQMSSSGSGAYKAEVYKWSKDDLEFVMLVFLNDKLTTKTQSGLNKNVNESLSLEQYNQLKDGMKFDEVVAILGEGEEQSSTEILGSSIVSYQWKGEGYAYASATFQNGKMTSKSQFGLK